MSRKEIRGSRAFAFPLFWIFVLVAFYWLLADCQNLPATIGSALAALPWQ
jgi:hypothetical protein